MSLGEVGEHRGGQPVVRAILPFPVASSTEKPVKETVWNESSSVPRFYAAFLKAERRAESAVVLLPKLFPIFFFFSPPSVGKFLFLCLRFAFPPAPRRAGAPRGRLLRVTKATAVLSRGQMALGRGCCRKTLYFLLTPRWLQPAPFHRWVEQAARLCQRWAGMRRSCGKGVGGEIIIFLKLRLNEDIR